MKQGFLITAYKDYEGLYELASYLSEHGNKVLIHVDAKSREIKQGEIEELNKIQGCYAISEFPIPWGGMNHVYALLALLKKAAEDKEISYIHCITGQDFPVISIEEIEERFCVCNQIYMDCIPPKDHPKQVVERFRYYNWFQNKNIKNPILWQIQNITVKLQKVLGIRRKRIGEFEHIYKGLFYVSMPKKAAKHVVDYCESNIKFLKDLSRCQLPEEIFFQTLFMNSEWVVNVADTNLRYMNWKRGDGSSPVYLDMQDYDAIVCGDYVFARKFDGKISKQLKEALIKRM